MKPKIYTVEVKIEGVQFEVDYTGLGEDCVVGSVHLPDSKVDLYNVLTTEVQSSAENAAYTDSDERFAARHEIYADEHFERLREGFFDQYPIPPSDADQGL